MHDRKKYSAPTGQNLIAVDLISLTNAGDVPSAQSAEPKWHLKMDIL